MPSADPLDLMDLPSLVEDAARENPEKLAIVEAGGRGLTWHQLDDEVGRVATGLAEQGVVAGYRVVIATSNRLEFVTTYLGALRAHAVAVPLNPRSTTHELARVAADCGARLIVADTGTVEATREAVSRLVAALAGERQLPDVPPETLATLVAPQVVGIGTTAQPGERTYDQMRAHDRRSVPPVRDPEQLAALLYTSGTSGLPRGAMLTHRALAANLAQVACVEPPMIHGDDVVLGVLPLFHVYGLNAVLGGVVRHRAKLVLADHFDPHGTLDLIDDEAVSVVPVAPPVIAHWCNLDLAGRLGPVRLVLSGSAPISPELVAEFGNRTGVPLHQGYGLTEAAPVVTSTLRSSSPKPGSVGAALTGIELRLVDEWGGTPSGDDPGEIWIRGANLFSGYWPHQDAGPDSDGWWPTGDVGFLDEDGDLFLVDRLKELVIVSGFNVYPVEVEHVVGEVAAVHSVAVIGVDDVATGEAVVAYVVAPGADPEQVEAEVLAHCTDRLARFKVPARVEVVDELPHTVTGKVQKGRLRRRERRRALEVLE